MIFIRDFWNLYLKKLDLFILSNRFISPLRLMVRFNLMRLRYCVSDIDPAILWWLPSLQFNPFLINIIRQTALTTLKIPPKMRLYAYTCALLPAMALGARQVPFKTSSNSPFTASFDKLAEQSLERWYTPGIAIAVVDGDDTFSKVGNFIFIRVVWVIDWVF